MFDWLATLGAQDQSLEGLMAKQDLSRKIQLLDQIARTKQAKDIADENRVERGREFDLRQKELEETRKEREQRIAQARADRQTTEKRLRYNTVVDNLRNQITQGVTPSVSDKDTADLIREYEGPSALTAAPGQEGVPDTMLKYLYQQQTAEAAAQKLKHEAERQAHQQKLQDQANARAAQAETRAQAEEARRVQREERAKKAFEKRQAGLDAQLSKMPPQVQAAASKEANLFIKNNPQGLMEFDDDAYQARIHEGIQKIYDQYEKDAVSRGLMPPRTPVVQGRGAGAGGPKTFNAAEARSKWKY